MPFLPTELAYRSPTGREPVEELPCDDQSTAVSLVLHINSPQNRPSFARRREVGARLCTRMVFGWAYSITNESTPPHGVSHRRLRQLHMKAP